MTLHQRVDMQDKVQFFFVKPQFNL